MKISGQGECQAVEAGAKAPFRSTRPGPSARAGAKPKGPRALLVGLAVVAFLPVACMRESPRTDHRCWGPTDSDGVQHQIACSAENDYPGPHE